MTKRASKSIAVVGTVNRDEIVLPSGERRENLGGILYNVVVLAALLRGTGIRILPVARLSRADADFARGLLAEIPEVDERGWIHDESGTNFCRLDYSQGGERVEHVELRVEPLSTSDLERTAGVDVLLVNMISGRDLALETMERLRRERSSRCFLDVQALARTLEAPRRPRAVPHWKRWCQAFDVVRGNVQEIGHWTGRKGDLSLGVADTVGAGPEEVYVTRGAKGSSLATQGSEGIRTVDRPAVPALLSVDETGCGDAFLSGLCAGHLLGWDRQDGWGLGAWVAARVAERSGLVDLLEISLPVRDDLRSPPPSG